MLRKAYTWGLNQNDASNLSILLFRIVEFCLFTINHVKIFKLGEPSEEKVYFILSSLWRHPRANYGPTTNNDRHNHQANSSAVTLANILNPDPMTTTTQQTSLLGLFPGELAKLHAENAIEKTATASMNITKICLGVVDLI
jgi:hypothetical protein